ncbi:response regulator transcription factor [Flavihumibacter profundi]|jgi:DNA-binding response OmpR family regulator|uniref:response regulator transcription factor n=1 Tax=Flavihumibacter profundi TaxID=2716883 RepID=UPI001CC65D03|nr:response regulator transcription factor [Flavihumibacter profundi]MBZ5856849.1 response regulator transcription factor [Flavihumibacter profundi]
MNILLLEDDFELAAEIVSYFKSKNFNCDQLYNGSLVARQLQLKPYDIAILDINVPGINGIEVCQQVRAVDKKIPILMLTAYGEIEDKVEAFNKGADDYIVKPFLFEELLIRVNALLRRSETPQFTNTNITIGDLSIDVDNMTVKRADAIVNLTPKEFKLLLILAEANGKVLSKKMIADRLWEDHIETNPNTIEVYINFLRNKIDKHAEDKLIHTKVGFGYFLKEL